MAYTPPTTPTAGQRVAASWGAVVAADIIDHEARMTALEGSVGATVLTADPGSPADDTWWVVRDGGSPQAVALKVRIGGVTYTLAEITL